MSLLLVTRGYGRDWNPLMFTVAGSDDVISRADCDLATTLENAAFSRRTSDP